jgi:6-phosphogluconate dehydrogenase (decarboxylating)
MTDLSPTLTQLSLGLVGLGRMGGSAPPLAGSVRVVGFDATPGSAAALAKSAIVAADSLAADASLPVPRGVAHGPGG